MRARAHEARVSQGVGSGVTMPGKSIAGRGRGLLSRAAIVGSFFLAAALATGVAAAQGIGFSAGPAPGTSDAGLGFYRLAASPGAIVHRTLVVSNPTGVAKHVRLSPVDAGAAVFGGVAYSDSDAITKGAGSWVSLSTTEATLPPGGRVRVPFTVTVPTETASGVHVGGISVWEPSAATASTSGTGTAVSTTITTVSRMVITVAVTLPGPAEPELKIGPVSAKVRSQGMYLVMGIANSGTALTSGDGTVAVQEDGFSARFPLGTMVPGSQTDYPVKWSLDPAQGTYHVTVEVTYANGSKVARWSGPISVTASDTAALAKGVPGGGGAAGVDWVRLVYAFIAAALLIMTAALAIGWGLGRRSARVSKDVTPRA